jgi:hypothetical protein
MAGNLPSAVLLKPTARNLQVYRWSNLPNQDALFQLPAGADTKHFEVVQSPEE